MKLFFFLFSSVFVLHSNGQNFSKLKSSNDNTYGYLQSNPLVINQGKTGKSYDYFRRLIDHLTTNDG
ncbi:MAG TPA: hypothetical protein VD794_05560 [Flavisolibacter sp.]|nr:hypothetical protein [Flavisolibacter sp.]